MIYEMRTYTMRPGGVPEFEERFAERKPYREKHSALGAFWRTEFGPLNQVIHVWPYEDLSHRDRVRDEARQAGAWPPQGAWRQSMIKQETKVLIPAAFSPMH